MSVSAHDGVAVIKPGQTYVGKQGFTYGAGASAETVGAQRVCMNVLPMPPGAVAKAHYHKGVETIAYMLEGECTVYYGDDLQKRVLVREGEQSFVPPTCRTRRATKVGNRVPGSSYIHPVAIRTASCCYRSLMQGWRRGRARQRDTQAFCASDVSPYRRHLISRYSSAAEGRADEASSYGLFSV